MEGREERRKKKRKQSNTADRNTSRSLLVQRAAALSYRTGPLSPSRELGKDCFCTTTPMSETVLGVFHPDGLTDVLCEYGVPLYVNVPCTLVVKSPLCPHGGSS